MAKVKIMYWKDIPYAVRAFDKQGRASRQLPERFSVAVDAVAMAEDATDQDSYRDGFSWGQAETREGTAAEVADTVVAELEAAYSQERLKQLIRDNKRNGKNGTS